MSSREDLSFIWPPSIEWEKDSEGFVLEDYSLASSSLMIEDGAEQALSPFSHELLA